jgi:hypothetical protein
VITLDNQRFIGNKGWRQMQQTFDSVVIRNQSIKNLTANYYNYPAWTNYLHIQHKPAVHEIPG